MKLCCGCERSRLFDVFGKFRKLKDENFLSDLLRICNPLNFIEQCLKSRCLTSSHLNVEGCLADIECQVERKHIWNVQLSCQQNFFSYRQQFTVAMGIRSYMSGSCYWSYFSFSTKKLSPRIFLFSNVIKSLIILLFFVVLTTFQPLWNVDTETQKREMSHRFNILTACETTKTLKETSVPL